MESLIALLHEHGYANSPELHGYHCDCASCDFESGGLFRAQRDSSCGGEVITAVLQSQAQVAAAAVALQEAAVAVDAEPCLRAGFHVHSDTLLLRRQDRLEEAFMEFLWWEPTLTGLSAGRWRNNRDNNTVCREMHAWLFRDRGVLLNRTTREAGVEFDLIEDVFVRHQEADRHSNLNVSSRYRTFEFRLFNSTRSAWRMEMFCGVAAAFTNPTFLDLAKVADINTTSAPSASTMRHNLDALAETLGAAGFDLTAEAVRRQTHYRQERATAAHALQFTVA